MQCQTKKLLPQANTIQNATRKKQHCSIVLPSVTDNALCLHGSMGGPSIFRAHPNPPTHHQSTSHRFLLPPKQPGLARVAAFLSYQLQFAFNAPNPNALAQLMDVNFARTSAFCPWQSASIRAGALLQGMAIPCSLPPFYMEGFFCCWFVRSRKNRQATASMGMEEQQQAAASQLNYIRYRRDLGAVDTRFRCFTRDGLV